MKKYTIKKGRHSSGFRVSPFLGKTTAKYEVIFTKSCIYNLNNINQFDVNKLFGLSYLYHHVNSARFGWRAVDDKIEIFAYCYFNSRRYIKDMCQIEVDTPYLMEIKNIGPYYEFEVRNLKTNSFYYLRAAKPKTVLYGYNLFPYFGGDEVAPHDVEIFMNRIE